MIDLYKCIGKINSDMSRLGLNLVVKLSQKTSAEINSHLQFVRIVDNPLMERIIPWRTNKKIVKLALYFNFGELVVTIPKL
jgi:hypothetical protein